MRPAPSPPSLSREGEREVSVRAATQPPCPLKEKGCVTVWPTRRPRSIAGQGQRLHRETLEIRLATEELWAQLSGAAPPAALVQSLGRIRGKLAEHYRLANLELHAQKEELEKLRGQLAAQHEALAREKCRFEEFTSTQQKEAQQQASRLIARERQLDRRDAELRAQSQQWQVERIELEQELRSLRAELIALEG